MGPSSSTQPIPQLGCEQARSLRLFSDILEQVRDRVDDDVRAAALRVPVFAALMEKLDPAEMEAQTELSRRLEREARPSILETEVPAHHAAAVERGESHEWTSRSDGEIYEARSFPLQGQYVGVIFGKVREALDAPAGGMV